MSMSHAPISNHLIVRLADEGVPLSAMSRALRRPFDEVLGVVTDAKQAGHLLAIPAADWPQGTRREERKPTQLPIRMQDVDDAVSALMLTYGVTRTEAVIVATLLRRPDQTKTTLHAAICDDSKATLPKIIDVMICKIRRKLLPFDIVIETIWGRGYRIVGPSRDALLRALASYRASFETEAAE